MAKLFWDDRKIEKAKAWFNRAVTLNADNGDNWAMFYKFTVQHGTPEEVDPGPTPIAKSFLSLCLTISTKSSTTRAKKVTNHQRGLALG